MCFIHEIAKHQLIRTNTTKRAITIFSKNQIFVLNSQKLNQACTWYTLAYKMLNNIHGSVKNTLKNCVISKHFVDHGNKLFR